jgi:hypothetical protein
MVVFLIGRDGVRAQHLGRGGRREMALPMPI